MRQAHSLSLRGGARARFRCMHARSGGILIMAIEAMIVIAEAARPNGYLDCIVYLPVY